MRLNNIECWIVDVSRGTRYAEQNNCKFMGEKDTLRCEITPKLNANFAIAWKWVGRAGYKRGCGLACTPWLDGIKMPTHVLNRAEVSSHVKGEIAGERSVTQFRPFQFGVPKISDSDLIAPRYDRRQAELYTIKLVFEWLPNCEPNDERAPELDELPDNSAILAIRYLHSSLVQDPPGISAQFGEPVPTNADNVRSAFPKTVSRINTFRFDEINKRDTVKFIFNYKPEEPKVEQVDPDLGLGGDRGDHEAPQAGPSEPRVEDVRAEPQPINLIGATGRDPSVQLQERPQAGPSTLLGKRQRSPDSIGEPIAEVGPRQRRGRLAALSVKIGELHDALLESAEGDVNLTVELQLQERGVHFSSTIRRVAGPGDPFEKRVDKGKGKDRKSVV